MASRIDPLSWQVPIVDDRGRVTKEFALKWGQLAKAAGSIPVLPTDAAGMSALLDLLGTVPNDVLIRGASQWAVDTPSHLLDKISAVNGSLLSRQAGSWQGLASPSDATKFLSGNNPPSWQFVHDADLSTSDVLTNNVSTTKHGFQPKLPNDSTKFMNGVGAYATPPGTTAVINALLGGVWTTNAAANAGAFATMVCVFNQIWKNMTIKALSVELFPTGADTYVATAIKFTTAGATVMSSVAQGVAPATASSGGGPQACYLEFATPITVLAGEFWGFGCSRTNGTGVSPTQMTLSAATSTFAGHGPLRSAAVRRIAKIAPITSDTMDNNAGSGFPAGVVLYGSIDN